MRVYNWLFLLCNVVNTYVIYRFMRYFLGERRTSATVEILSYIVYYIGMAGCYFLITIPNVMMIYSLVAFFALSFNYRCGMKNRIWICAIIYCILVGIEMLIAVTAGRIYVPMDRAMGVSSIGELVANPIIGLMVVNVLRPYRSKQKIVIPVTYWISIILIPVFSIYFLLVSMHMGIINRRRMLVVICMLLAVNFAVIYLYDFILKAIGEKSDRLLIEQQNKYYQNQLSMMEGLVKSDRSFQHDLKNHLLVLKSYLNNDDVQGAIQYVSEMQNYEKQGYGNFSQTDNSIIDGILNLKLQEAQQKGIDIVTDICIPQNLIWNSFDATVLLCNMLDNAMEATEKISDKQISIDMKYDRNRLIIKIRNTYNGKLQVCNGIFVTAKRENALHGIGMQNIKSVVEKYHGVIKVHYDEHWFEIMSILYV